MAVLLPTRAYVKTFDTSEVVRCGSFDLAEHTELIYVRFLLYKHGTPGGSERIRAKIYTDSDYTQLLYTSAYSNLSDVTGLTTDWFGWFRLTFNREHIHKEDTTYYIALETSGYTRNGDTFYLSASLDWPLKQNLNGGSANNPGLMLQIYGYRSV